MAGTMGAVPPIKKPGRILSDEFGGSSTEEEEGEITDRPRETRAEALDFLNQIQRAPTFMTEAGVRPKTAAKGKNRIVYPSVSESMKTFMLENTCVRRNMEQDMSLKNTGIVWPKAVAGDIILKYMLNNEGNTANKSAWSSTVVSIFTSVLQSHVAVASLSLEEEMRDVLEKELQKQVYKIDLGQVNPSEFEVTIIGQQSYVSKTYLSLNEFLSKMGSTHVSEEIPLKTSGHEHLLQSLTWWAEIQEHNPNVNFYVAKNVLLLSGKNYAIPKVKEEALKIVSSFVQGGLESLSKHMIGLIRRPLTLIALNNHLKHSECCVCFHEEQVYMIASSSETFSRGEEHMTSILKETLIPVSYETTRFAKWLRYFEEAKRKSFIHIDIDYLHTDSTLIIFGFAQEVEPVTDQVKDLVKELEAVPVEDYIDVIHGQDLDKDILNFISENKDIQGKLIADMKRSHTRIHWPDEQDSALTLIYDCNDAPNETKLFWHSSVLTIFQSLISSMVMKYEMSVHEGLENEVQKELEKDTFTTFGGKMMQKEGVLAIIGPKSEAKDIHTKLQYFLASLEASVDVVQIKLEHPEHLNLVSAKSFAIEFKLLHPTIDIIIAKDSVVIKGPIQQLKKADHHLRENLNLISFAPLKLPEDLHKVVARQVNIDKINRGLTKFGYTCVCYIQDADIMVVASTEDHLQETFQNLNCTMKRSKIVLVKEVMAMKPWNKYFAKLQEGTGAYLGISLDDEADTIHIYGITEDVDKVKGKVEEYLQKLAIVDIELTLDNFIGECLKRHGRNVKEELMEKYNTQCLDLKFIYGEGVKPRIKVRCTQQVVEKLHNDLNLIAGEIKTEDLVVEQIGLDKYFIGEGSELLDDVGHRLQTYIVLHDRPKSTADGDELQTIEHDSRYVLKFTSGLRISLNLGSIVDQRVDVIVNTTSSRADFSGQLSQAIKEKGGPGMAKDLEVYQSQSTKFKAGHVLSTKPHSLRCKSVHHMLFDNWDGKDQSKRLLITAINSVLKKASDNGYTSVAFPAIGSGGFGWPPKVVANCFLSVIHGLANKLRNVKDIRMVILPSCQESVESYADEIFRQQIGLKVSEHNVPQIKKGAYKGVSLVEAHDQQTPTMHFTIYGFQESKVTKSKARLESKCKERHQKLSVEKQIIEMITDRERQKMRQIISGKGMTMEINQSEKKSYVQLEGLKGEVDSAMREINDILTELEIIIMVGDQGRGSWEYERPDGILSEFSRTSNGIIELACQQGKTGDIEFQENDVDWTVSLGNMEATYDDDQTYEEQTVTVYRRSADLPKPWFPIEEKRLFLVDELTEEFASIKVDFFRTLGDQSANAVITWVKRIQHPDLYRGYTAQRARMKKQLEPGEEVVERLLWHGTSKQTISQINNNGFDRSYSEVAAYGKGVYFAVNSEYSAHTRYSPVDGNGMQRMYYAQVLVGKYTPGNGKMKACPAIDPKKPSVKFDSLCDNPQNPTIHVICNDAQAYPAYLVYFALGDKAHFVKDIELETEENF